MTFRRVSKNLPATLAAHERRGREGVPNNGLRELAGTWNERQYRAFENAVAPLRKIDPELRR